MRFLANWRVLILILALQGAGAFGAELVLPSLTVGGQLHSNVVVSPSSKGRVMVHYGTGLGTVRIADLDYEVLKQLAEAQIIGGKAVDELLSKKAPKKQRDWQSSTNGSGMDLMNGDI